MDTVTVTYIGSSGRRRGRGKTESYWFRPQASLSIPVADVEAVTGSDPENWRVERPKGTPAAQDTLQQGWPTAAPATPRRRRGRRRAAATETVNEE